LTEALDFSGLQIALHDYIFHVNLVSFYNKLLKKTPEKTSKPKI